MADARERVTILVSGVQASGEVVTPDAVRAAYAELPRWPVVMDVTSEVPLQYLEGSDRLKVVVGSVTDFVLETLADGRTGITGRLTMRHGQPRCAG